LIRFLQHPTACIWLVVLAACLTASSLSGQSLSTVQGTVTNEAGRPLEQAQVTLDRQGTSRQMRTDRDGRFSFAGVSPGSHSIRVTWVGFSPESRDVNVVAGVNTIDFVLRRLTRLDTTVVTARRTGIYGSVISIDSLLPVPGARVEILGAREADSTNSSGIYNFPGVRGGSYIVRIKHPFFDSRNFSVVVPDNGGTELDVVLERGRVSRDAHMEMLYREMDSRLNVRGINSAFATREEFKGREKMLLDQALAFIPEFAKRSLYIPSDVCVFVDGIPRPGAMLRDFAPEDIESVELYGASNRSILRNRARAVEQADPTGSIRSRWPAAVAMAPTDLRYPCGQPPPPSERLSESTMKVWFAFVWLRK
jgi:hypothetical protein